MIKRIDSAFLLQTAHTTYCFQVTKTGHLEHLYYGASLISKNIKDANFLTADDLRAMSGKRAFEGGNLIAYDPDHKAVNLEDMCLELSSTGKGDIREPFVELIYADGSRTSDFLFSHAEICHEKSVHPSSSDNLNSGSDKADETAEREMHTLPGSYSEDGRYEHLIITLREAVKPVTLELHYYIYPECDVITRTSCLINEGEEDIRVERLMSLQLDLPDMGYEMTSFHGAWAREMGPVQVPIREGAYVVSSDTGTSSNRANPFVMLHPAAAGEESGACIGLNLIYSGNHYECAQVNAYGKTRFVSGINPRGFSWLLKPGESFQAPEAVMTWSDSGFGGISRNMHTFVREHIVRGYWKKRERPILLNSWEASYFDISEKKLLKLAQKAKEAGIELFVMDDGWFGSRNDDSSSLGDWFVNEKKLPGGLAGLCGKVNALGLDFGIWVEPEMVSPDSDLYRKHPDWAMGIPGRSQSLGRNQMILDLANPAVCDYLIDVISDVFSSANISYVKWDMNRIFSDIYSPYLPPERQGETAHRYICGLYRIMETLTGRFPKILFEGCAAGGNRFDLGILSYFPQIWASDNTDALCRAEIQEGYSYGYPMSTVSAHVSGSPNHQTLRETPLDTRFGVAAFGILGYECNLVDMKKEELAEIKKQVETYKRWRKTLQFGTFYRGRGTSGMQSQYARPGVNYRQTILSAALAYPNVRVWTCVSPDRKEAVGFVMQQLVRPNHQYLCYKARGLDPSLRYHFYNEKKDIDIRLFGDLINTASPIHIRPGSLLHSAVARFKTMPGEREDYHLPGSVLMNAGVKLSPAFAGTGYDENVRFFQDFSSRMYYMIAEE